MLLHTYENLADHNADLVADCDNHASRFGGCPGPAGRTFLVVARRVDAALRLVSAIGD
jgi:hypothetical protein